MDWFAQIHLIFRREIWRRGETVFKKLTIWEYTLGLRNTAPFPIASNGAGPSKGYPKPTNI